MRKLIAIFCLICCAANAQTFKALMLNSGTLAIAYPAQASVPALLAANGIAALTDVATLGTGATNFVRAQGVAQTNDTTLRIAAHGVAQTNDTTARLATQGTGITNYVVTILATQGTSLTNYINTALASQGTAQTNDTSTRLASQGVAITNAYTALFATSGGASLSDITNVVNALVPPATNISVPFYWTSGGVTNASVNTNGTITAIHFVGDGSGLTGLGLAAQGVAQTNDTTARLQAQGTDTTNNFARLAVVNVFTLSNHFNTNVVIAGTNTSTWFAGNGVGITNIQTNALSGYLPAWSTNNPSTFSSGSGSLSILNQSNLVINISATDGVGANYSPRITNGPNASFVTVIGHTDDSSGSGWLVVSVDGKLVGSDSGVAEARIFQGAASANDTVVSFMLNSNSVWYVTNSANQASVIAFKQDLTGGGGGSGLGYALHVLAVNSATLTASSRFVLGDQSGVNSIETSSHFPIKVLKAGTIKALSLNFHAGTLASAGSMNVYVTNYTQATATAATGISMTSSYPRLFAGGLSCAVSAGDDIDFVFETPAWGTAPVADAAGNIYIE